MTETLLMDEAALGRAIKRLAHEILERDGDNRLCILGVKRRGVILAEQLARAIDGIRPGQDPVPTGTLDTTLYRDDMSDEDKVRMAEDCTFPCRLEDRTVIVVDDVLYTGRTARAAMEAVFAAGRPKALQLAILVDRGHRELPIKADFVGKNIPTAKDETVEVNLAEVDGRTGVYLRRESAYTRLPGLCDVHVHFREPGRTDKETIATGCAAAVAGGYTTVCPMPNTTPVMDTPEHLQLQLDIIKRDAPIQVLPYASITHGESGREVVDMAALAPMCVAFSDDGVGLNDPDVMREAMEQAAHLGKLIAAHCEDKTLIPAGGCINDGPFAREHGYVGINDESEWAPIARDARLAGETGASYHVCHVSTATSVEVIRAAKAKGIDITCEVTPHHLLMDETDLREEGRFKMNPPLRSPEDREACIRGLQDGTIDFIATDHAPHTAEEKARGLADAPFGIVGLETAFPLLYTNLVLTGN